MFDIVTIKLLTLHQAAAQTRTTRWLLILIAHSMLFVCPAYARQLSGPEDPALSSALVTRFQGLGRPANPYNFPVILGSGEHAVIVTVSTTPGAPYVLADCPGTTECEILAWGGDAGSHPIRLQFDRPVAAVGILMNRCDAGFNAFISGIQHGEPFAGDRAFCLRHTPRFIGATDIGNITEVTLASNGSYSSNWTDLRVVPAAATAAGADLFIENAGPAVPVGANRTISLPLLAGNLGPDAASGASVVDLLPLGARFASADPSATLELGGLNAVWSLGDLLPGANRNLVLTVTTPSPGQFSCTDRMVNVAIIRSNTRDPHVENNIAVSSTPFDRAVSTVREICDNGIDDNCDGNIDCADPQCSQICALHLPDIGHGGFPNPGTPPLPRLPADQPPQFHWPFDDWRDTPTQQPQGPNYRDRWGRCTRQVHGVETTVPPWCCDAALPPGFTDSEYNAICVPHDPNFKESLPRTNALGYGWTRGGEVIHYIVHYENDGGADAHQVTIVDVLDPALDETTLDLEGHGRYDNATRTVIWVDPVVFPHDPRHFTYSVKVRADARVGTRIRNLATIIFPDAVPPSRIDTNFVEHVIPNPDFPIKPELAVFRCEPIADRSNEWSVLIENRGLGFAYNVRATLKNPPPSVNVLQGTASHFSHPADPKPDQLATVIPLQATRSSDTVSFIPKTGKESCEAFEWEISYTTSSGEQVSSVVQAAKDANHDGIPDYLQATGCGCTGSPAPLTQIWVPLAVLLSLFWRTRLAARISGHRRR